MKRFRHILAPTDMSHESLSVVSYAAHLAKAQDAKLTVLHTAQTTSLLYTDFVPPIDMAMIDARVEDAATAHLEKWAKSHLRRNNKVKLMVRSGIVSDMICDTAEEIGASVIVMATHGRSGLAHLVLGSTTESVLRKASCPVMVLKPPAAKKSAAKKTAARKAATRKTKKKA